MKLAKLAAAGLAAGPAAIRGRPAGVRVPANPSHSPGRQQVSRSVRHGQLSDRALATHERLPMPVEPGRTLLAQAAVPRRAKQKAAARDADV